MVGDDGAVGLAYQARTDRLRETRNLRYISTRGGASPLDFESAMLTGLASDGGLFLPERWPRLDTDELLRLAGRPYEEIVLRVVQPFIGRAFGESELKRLIADAYAAFRHPARCPLVQIDANLHLLELFHGPTLAFKDFALQLVGRLFAESLRRRGRRAVIVGATSGDTGSAAIEAFRGSAAADVFILYPHQRVSEVQRRQMTTPAEGNVHALAVEGDFDDCQACVKAMFNDAGFRDEFGLGAVNSINWARIAVQAAYYFAAALALGAPHRSVSFTVPTGNFGDVFAGYAAKQMGLPVAELVIATNRNDILHRALTSGSYRTGPVHATISPSMDIQISSNFERALFEAGGRDGGRIAALMKRLGKDGFEIPPDMLGRLRSAYESGCATEEETRACIADVWKTAGTAVCPHSAVGVKVARDHCRGAAVPMVALATAHPAKFPDAVRAATGVSPPLPDRMAELHTLPERVTVIPNDVGRIQAFVRDRAGS